MLEFTNNRLGESIIDNCSNFSQKLSLYPPKINMIHLTRDYVKRKVVVQASFSGDMLPLESMYSNFTYISPKNQPNVGEYAIHGFSGLGLGEVNYIHSHPNKNAVDEFFNVLQPCSSFSFDL